MVRLGKSIAKQSEGRAGEKYLPVGGRVRRLDFLSILLCHALLSQTGELLSFWRAGIVFLRPASLARSEAEREKQKIPCQDADLVDFMQVIR